MHYQAFVTKLVSRPRALFVVVAVVVFATQFTELLTAPLFPNLSPFAFSIVDGMIDFGLLCPILYFLVFLPMVIHIRERQRAEESVHASQVRLQEQAALLDETADAILVQGLDNQITYWNRGAEKLYDRTAEEALGKNAWELLYKTTPVNSGEIHTILLSTGAYQFETEQVKKDGKTIVSDTRFTLMRDETGAPKSILQCSTDVTEKKKLEAKFLRAQRMESIGTLAGGIAHDLNNVLTPILIATELLKADKMEERTAKLLETVESSVRRGAGMVKQVLTFARGVEGQRMPVQLRHLVKDLQNMLKETLPKSMTIRASIANDLWPILADVTQLHQVLLNLCVNARDAMPNGGTLTINAENGVMDQNAMAARQEKPGNYVVIKVKDTGTGIPREILDRIFEPFFTTKEIGKGTGLGLSTVAGIVKSHGGFVDVYSEVGRGTEFRVCLPAMESAEAEAVSRPRVVELPVGRGELVLVADDELSVREMMRMTLETHGYQVMTANDGIEALAVYAKNSDRIHGVISDMNMPILDGMGAARALRKIAPNVKIIAMSGLAAHKTEAELAGVVFQEFLLKPCTLETLLHTLREVLDR